MYEGKWRDYFEESRAHKVPELLNRWIELEPVRFLTSSSEGPLYLALKDSSESLEPDAFTKCGAETALAVAAAAVLYAIDRRGWTWTGGSGFSIAKHTFTVYGEPNGSKEGRPTLAHGYSNNDFAEAALNAYTWALQVVNT